MLKTYDNISGVRKNVSKKRNADNFVVNFGTTVQPATSVSYAQPIGISAAQAADNQNIQAQLLAYIQSIPATARTVPLTNYYYNQLADLMGYSLEASAGYNFETFRNYIKATYPSVYAGIEAQIVQYGNAAADAIIKANTMKAVQAIPALAAAIATGNIKPFLSAVATGAAQPTNPALTGSTQMVVSELNQALNPTPLQQIQAYLQSNPNAKFIGMVILYVVIIIVVIYLFKNKS